MKDLRIAIGNVPLVLGLLGVLAIAFVALFGARIAPLDPQAWRFVEFYDNNIIIPPSPPDSHHLLGTDPIGRDQLSRLLWGARLTLESTLLAVAGRMALGLGVGALVARLRGRWSTALVSFTNIISGYPQLMLALLVAVALRDLGVLGFVVALAIVGWPDLARFLGGELRRISGAPYVEAARAMGASPRRVALGHVARNALPQIVGVTALETASVLLLLAELGFIGVFLVGGVALTDDFGRPVPPVRDRAPEWGQMLAGAQGYITTRQWVAYVPALVVVAAVFVFNLFGEGIRGALDPHGGRALSPRALGWAARGMAIIALVGASASIFSSVAAAKGLSYDEGFALAQAAAQRERPGSVLVASVVRFSSQSHALDRPEKLNYYFVDPKGDSLRVGYVDADPNAAEVRLFEDEDGLTEIPEMTPVGSTSITWQAALLTAERDGGNAYRTASRGWTTRIVLRQASIGPVFRVRYGPSIGNTVQIDIPIDARTGSIDVPLDVRLGEAYDRVVRILGAGPRLVRMGALWSSSGLNFGLGAGGPTAWSFDFISADGSGPGVTANGGVGSVLQVFTRPAATKPPPLPEAPDLQTLFNKVEDAGGRAVRAEWDRGTPLQWQASGSLEMTDTGMRFTVSYGALTSAANLTAQFQLDLATGVVRRVR